ISIFNDCVEYELVSMARYGTNKARTARVVAERPTNRSDRLAEGAVGHDDVAPDLVEDLTAVDGFVAVFDQEDERIEIARDKRQLALAADKQPASRRHDELAEAIAGHGAQPNAAIVSE